ncbi:hypothetical protein [Thermomonospora umbrina]|uniref:Uncharacterized protein n=1 Tax=Thermomonospora umbrina TaxID=111806 RepID=A0A3D9SXE2_9ACTN|nr:hypothetical protein [Thermomonospora umbrina]REF00623.1 hypothetical protein DFJ69_6179 [Thermomonospora umbrina]
MAGHDALLNSRRRPPPVEGHGRSRRQQIQQFVGIDVISGFGPGPDAGLMIMAYDVVVEMVGGPYDGHRQAPREKLGTWKLSGDHPWPHDVPEGVARIDRRAIGSPDTAQIQRVSASRRGW